MLLIINYLPFIIHVFLCSQVFKTMRRNDLQSVVDDEVRALVVLAHTPLLGSIKIRLMLRHFGSAVVAAACDPAELADLPGFGSTIMQAFRYARQKQPWQQTLELAEKHSIHILPFTDPGYPQGLLDLVDFPVVLYIKGQLTKYHHSLAVVGTRQASLYGMEMAYRLSLDLAHRGFTIVSGLARGIDTQAHRAALVAKRRTVAVIGSGLLNIYPHENARLSEEIAVDGALVSEFPPTTPPDRQNFPQRNRLVATMTHGTLLVEAPYKSGAMITMHRALSHQRPLFALPGRVDVDSFRGNHALIKVGKATLIENADDIASTFSDLFPARPATVKATQFPIPLDQSEKELLEQFPSEEVSIDDLMQKTQLPIAKLNVLLMSLLLKKIIREFPGKLYKRIS